MLMSADLHEYVFLTVVLLNFKGKYHARNEFV